MKKFARDIIKWQQAHGRHDLPWQNSRDPYRIWISEIMLQQTQVSAVIGYFERFMQRFPNVESLASATIDDVMPYWAGLGYYARARNVHKSATLIAANADRKFPRRFDDVWALPGVGRSTAAAICVFAYSEPRPILDGNVKRVFARFFGIAGDIRSKAIENEMWLIADRETPTKNIESYIQGQMDIGATICSRHAPKCLICPLQKECVANQEQRTHELPERGSKKDKPHRQIQMIVMRSANEVLIERRPPTGIWGGLWSLPEAAINDDATTIAKSRFGVMPARGCQPSPQTKIEHSFTHFSLTIFPVTLIAEARGNLVSESGWRWLNLDDIEHVALPAPVKTLLLHLHRSLTPSTPPPSQKQT